MAGYRIKKGAGPKRGELRAVRRRARLAERLAEASTPADQIFAAAQHLRGVVKSAPPAAADRAASMAVQYLIGLADQVLDGEGRAA
ncbi:MAG: hypothetical protein ACRDT6_16175 [Micromonosporaceae bacterium]